MACTNRSRRPNPPGFARAVALCVAVACAAPPGRPVATPDAASVRRLDGTAIGHAEIDATVTRLMAAAQVPGLGLAIVNEGRVVYLKAYGWRDVERRLPMTIDTVMSGASLTKAAFAIMAMQLVAEGRLDLDRSIERYLDKPLVEDDDYRDLAADDRHHRFTARMLLDHTSGMPNWRRFNDDQKLDIKSDPGTRYAYSGEGIALLQRVVKAITRASTRDQMDERVFRRLGMTRTSMVWRPEFETDHAIGYDPAGKPLGHSHRESPDAAGSMDTTVRDWAQLLAALLRGEGLPAEARAEMLRPQIRIHSAHQFPPNAPETTHDYDAVQLSYGLGWGLLATPYGKAYFKEGHDDGVQNYCISFDGPRTAIVIMTNSDNGESMFKELLATLIADTFTPAAWENYVPYNERSAALAR
jgi:CubicO group peptidase (beta-lactamase class C family)